MLGNLIYLLLRGFKRSRSLTKEDDGEKLKDLKKEILEKGFSF